MVEVGTRSLPVKVRQEKILQSKKLDGKEYLNKFSISYRRIFLIAIFFVINFYGKTLIGNLIKDTVHLLLHTVVYTAVCLCGRTPNRILKNKKEIFYNINY